MILKPYMSTESVRPGGEVSQVLTASPGTNSAQMVIFSPRKYAHQRVRPLVYKFTDEMKSSLATNLIDSSHRKTTPFSKLNDINARAILPASHQGFDLHMGTLEDFNGFLLIITTAGTRFAPPEKVMYGGYFMDDVRSFSGRYNMNAHFVITHTSILTDNRNNRFNTRENSYEIAQDTVTISRDTENFFENNDRMFINLPADINSLPPSHLMTGSSDASNIVLSNLGNPVSLPKFSTVPSLMLNAIGDNLRDFVDNREIYRYGMTNYTPMYDDQDHQEHIHIAKTLRDRLPGLSDGHSYSINQFLDESHTHTLGELEAKFGELSVIYVDQKDLIVANGESIDQGYDGRQNQLSYLISYAIETVALNSGLVTVDFVYHSHVPNSTIWTGRKNPTIVTQYALPIADVSQNQMNAMIKQFEQNIIDYVFSTVSAAMNGSDYEVYVHWRHGQAAQVKLLLNDYRNQTQDGYYESYGHISSLTTPTVANADTVFSNHRELEGFHDAIKNL